MPLTLQVKDADHLLPAQDVSRVLEVGTLTIGRGLENDWVLPDPERVISKKHCEIQAEGGRYRLTDMSSNGVFHNAADTPVGRGCSVTLESGDTFRISHFEVEVTVTEEDALIMGQTSDPSELFADDDSLMSEGPSDTSDLFLDENEPIAEPAGRASGFFDDDQSPIPADEESGDEGLARLLGESNEPDPFAEPAAGDAPSKLPDVEFGFGSDFGEAAAEDQATALEHAPTGQDFMQIPEAAPAIPDDWDDEWTGGETTPDTEIPGSTPILPEDADSFGEAARAEADIPAEPVDLPPPQAPVEPAPAQRPPAQRPPAKAAPAAQPPREPDLSQAAALKHFLTGAGLENLEIPDAQAAEMLEMLGRIYRTVIQGLMEVLAARSSIKNEFRLSQTMIQPVENNPLKFSLGVDDAMTALLTKKSHGYMPPVEAVEESFEDIKAHQVAVLAGMQVALTGLLAKFDPEALESRIEEEKGIAKLLTGKKARYWDEFNRLYKQLATEAEDDFQSIFGREFGRAYEEQVRKQGR